MKLFVVLLFWVFSNHLVFAQHNSSKQFEITGIINGIGNSKVLLGNKPNGFTDGFKIRYLDSCISKNDSFYFKGSLLEPDFYSIEVVGFGGWCSFVLENSKIQIKGVSDSIWRSAIIGSKEQDKYIAYNLSVYKPLNNKRNNIWSKIDLIDKTKDSVQYSTLRDSVQYYTKLIKAARLTYIDSHRKDFVSLNELNKESDQMELDTARKYYSKLSAKLKNHIIGQKLYYELFVLPQNIKTGMPVPNFSLQDTSGKKVSILDFSGKYLIIDFWASWCAPCIAEMPELKKIYAKFRMNRVEVLGVSLDHVKNNWVRATNIHGINWTNISDLKGAENIAAVLFGVKIIPQKFLIGKDGVLLLRNTTMLEIEKKLDVILATDQ